MRMQGVIAATVLTVTAAGAAPLNINEIPATAKWVAHADLAAFRNTEMGAAVLEHLGKGEANRKLAALAAVAGFDPRRDLTGVSIFGSGQDESSSAAIARGHYDRSHLETLAQAGDGYQSQTHAGATIHSWIEKNGGREHRTYAAIAGDGAVVIGQSEPLVKAALQAAGTTAPGGPADLKSILPAQPAAFMIAAADMASMPRARPGAEVLRRADSASLSLAETGGAVTGVITLGAVDGETAEQVESLANGMLALATLAQENNPELADMASRARVTRTGSRVVLKVDCPVAMMLDMIDARMSIQMKAE